MSHTTKVHPKVFLLFNFAIWHLTELHTHTSFIHPKRKKVCQATSYKIVSISVSKIAFQWCNIQILHAIVISISNNMRMETSDFSHENVSHFGFWMTHDTHMRLMFNHIRNTNWNSILFRNFQTLSNIQCVLKREKKTTNKTNTVRNK